MSVLVRVSLIIVTIVLVPASLHSIWKSLNAKTATDRAMMLLFDVLLTGAQWVVLLHVWGVVA